MSWVSGNCQGDRRYECTYGTYVQNYDPYSGLPTYEWVTWCKDSDSPCFEIDDGGGLIGVVDHNAQSGGGW